MPSENRVKMNKNFKDCYDLLNRKQSHAFQDVWMSLRTEDDPVRIDYKEYSKNYECLRNLVFAIESAEKEQNDKSTDGITAAVDVVNLYAAFLKKKGSIEAVIQKCAESLNLLTADIKNCPLELAGGERMQLALYSVGYAIGGFVLSIFNLAATATVVIPFVFAGVNKEIWRDIGKLFQSAFENFKEAWTGKRKPPEMSKLEAEMVGLGQFLKPPISVAGNPHSFHSQTKPKDDQEHVEGSDPSITPTKSDR